jgi:hypothetical protein
MIYQWILAAITILVPAWAGGELLGFFGIFRERTLQWIIGTIAGIALFGTSIYYVAHITTLQPVIIWTILALFFFSGTALRLRQISKKKKLDTDGIAIALFIASLILFAIIGSKLHTEMWDGIRRLLLSSPKQRHFHYKTLFLPEQPLRTHSSLMQ